MFDFFWFWTGKNILRGKSIYLRQPRRRDCSQWVEVRRVSKEFLQPWEPTWPKDGAEKIAFKRRMRRFTDDWESETSYAFFIFSNVSDELLGGITLTNVRRGVTQSGAIGYWIGAPYARRGYMSEAVGLLFDFAFDELELHRLEAACLVRNEPSRKLLLKMGFTQEGIARQYLRINGQWQDHRTFGILRSDRRVLI